MKKRLRYSGLFMLAGLLFFTQQAHAAGPPEPSIFSNPLALALLLVMALLLIVIGVLSAVLIGTADLKRDQRKKSRLSQSGVLPVLMAGVLLLNSQLAGAQEETEVAAQQSSQIGGMDPYVFYIINAVIFLEFLIIMGLLYNIRILLKKEAKRLEEEGLSPEAIRELQKSRLSWWDRFNKLKPVSQEAELDLGHEYDGIRELDNRLPPWWLYGFYLSIIVAVIYLWRFHVSHTAASSEEEYITSVETAQLRIQEYLKKKGDAVDENTVVVLSSADDLEEGKMIFQRSCASCHKESGAGDVGPNLTDDYWLHGNDIKSVFKTIRYGINAMPQWQNTYSNKQIAQVASYVKSLHGTNPPGAKAPQGIEMKEQVTLPADSTVTDNKAVTIR